MVISTRKVDKHCHFWHLDFKFEWSHKNVFSLEQLKVGIRRLDTRIMSSERVRDGSILYNILNIFAFNNSYIANAAAKHILLKLLQKDYDKLQ